MNEYGLVDLSNPQHLKARIREYTVKTVYDIFQKVPCIDWRFQYHCYLMNYCNHVLRAELKENQDKSFWKEFKKKYDLSADAMDQLARSYDLSRFITNKFVNDTGVDGFHYYIFFALYRAFYRLTEVDAVTSLLNEFGESYASWYPNYNPGENRIRSQGYLADLYTYSCWNDFPLDYMNEDSGYQYSFRHNPGGESNNRCIFIVNSNFSSGLPLACKNIIAKRRTAVFLIDSLNVATRLQREYDGAYAKFLKNGANDFWRKMPYNSPAGQPTGINKLLDEINNLRICPGMTTELYSNVIWSSWFGGYDLLEKTDWTLLQERNVYLFQIGVPIEVALEHFVRVGRHVAVLSGAEFSLVWLEKKTDVENTEHNPFKMLSYLEGLEQAHQHGIELDDTQASLLAQYLRDLGRIPRREKRFLIDPIIRLNTFTVISGREGSGKSWLAMILGAALSVRGTLFHDWEVIRKANVVYVADDEMDEDILDDRREVLRKLYRHYADHFVFESVHRKNLLDETTRKELETRIDQLFLKMDSTRSSVLILDHLNKLTDNEGNSKDNWPTIRKWIEDLNKKKISVILIHHEYNQGKMTGTVLIPQDAHTHIHVEHGKQELGKHAIELVYTVPKNKGGKDQWTPNHVILDLEHGARFRLPNEPNSRSENPWKSLPLDEQISKVRDLWKDMTLEKVADYFGYRKSSFEKFCQKHDIRKNRKRSTAGSTEKAAEKVAKGTVASGERTPENTTESATGDITGEKTTIPPRSI